jgi:hypothetical protein
MRDEALPLGQSLDQLGQHQREDEGDGKEKR